MLAVALVALLAASGCGGDDGDDNSSQTKLKVSQASADVEQFCRLHKTTDYIYNRPYILMVKATTTLIDANRTEDPGMKVWLDPARPEIPLGKIVRDSAAKLKRCGPDGRQQAARLQRAISAGQAPAGD